MVKYCTRETLVIKTISLKLNKHLAHITYERIRQTEEDRFWDFQLNLESLLPTVLLFAKEVDHQKLHENLQIELEAKTWQQVQRKLGLFV